MSAPSTSSPFDDLLRELDGLPSDSKGPIPDATRTQALQKLMEASKLLESIAAGLDPSDPKHPLHGLTLPDEAKHGLQAIVERLMSIQDELNAMEQQLVEPSTEALPSEAPATPPAPTKPTPPAATPAPSPQPTAPSEAYVKANAALETEKATFAAYRQQWEATFAADPAQRIAHPEVLAYYDQMEKYFIDQEAYLKTL